MVGGITPGLEVFLEVFDVVGVGANSKVHADLSGWEVADCQQNAFADSHELADCWLPAKVVADCQHRGSLAVTSY